MSATCSIQCSVLIGPTYSVYQKPWNFSVILSNPKIETVRVQINAITFIFFQADVRTFDWLGSLRDVSVIGNTLSYGFPQTVFSHCFGTCGIWSAIRALRLSFLLGI